MGKQAPKAKSPSKADVSADIASQVSELKSQAQQAVLSKEFAKAAEAYTQSIGLLPDGASDKQDALLKRAGCYLQLKKFAEAAQDASTVLSQASSNPTALKTRAKALQAQGKLRAALADYEKLNASPMATKETREAEAAVRSALMARPASAGARPQGPAPALSITIKATLNGDSRLLYTDLNVSYASLLEQIRAKFPGCGPVALKFSDPDGDQVTIQSRQDIQAALQHLIISYQRQLQSSNVPDLLQKQGLPALKVSVVPVSSHALVPKPPAAELAEIGKTAQDTGGGGQYEVEEWLMDFVRLFTEVTGIDPSAHYEQSQQGMDKVQRALQDTLAAEEAEELLGAAGDHYRDAAVTCLIQWGNTFIVKADRKLQAIRKAAAASGGSGIPEGAELQAVLGLYDQTQAKLEEALRLAPNSWEAVSSLGQLEWERAKAKLGHALTPAQPSEGSADKSPEAQQAEVQAAMNKQLVEIMSKVPSDKVLSVKPHIEKAGTQFERALGLARATYEAKQAKDKEREAKSKDKEGAAEAAPADSFFNSPPSSVMVMYGNILYDWSQVLSITGAEPWRPVLDAAAVRFRESGAPEADVRAALKNHLRAEELDLGPDPVPEEATPRTPEGSSAEGAKKTGSPAPAAAPPPPPAPEAKGLPSLEVKKPAKNNKA